MMKVNWRLEILIAICIYPALMRAEPLECDFKDVDLLPCLTTTDGKTTEACCLALDQALKAGHHCLCSLLSHTNPLLDLSLLALNFHSCSLISPSLASCPVPLGVNSTAVHSKEPVVDPVVAAPAPKLMDSASNSTQTPTGNPQLARETPRANQYFGPMFGYNSNGASAQMHKSLAAAVFLVSIFALVA